MVFSFQTKFIVGIEASSSHLRIACLRHTRSGWRVFKLEEVSPHVKPLDISLPKGALIATSLEARDVWMRSLSLQLKKERDIQATLPFEIESFLPYPLENCTLQKQIIEVRKEDTLLTAFVVRHEELQTHLDFFKQWHIEPDHISSTSLALAQYASSAEPMLLLHVGEERTTCVVAASRKVLAARTAYVPLKEVNQPSFQQELLKSVLALRSQLKDKALSFATAFGVPPAALLRLEQILGIPIHFPQLPYSIEEGETQKYALAIGIALSSTSPTAPNFRQEPFAHPQRWKAWKKPLFASMTLLALLTSAFWGWSQLSLQKQMGLLHNSYLNLLSVEEKPTREAPPANLAELSQRLSNLDREILARHDTFPLTPRAPRVSDALAWVTTSMRTLSTAEGKGFTLNQFLYQMAKYPSLILKKERYSLRIDLEFTTDTPSLARSFHDLLLAPNPFVDAQQPVQWNMRDNNYQASFFLKDLTDYRRGAA